jgi:AraC-like DNA-binding protein
MSVTSLETGMFSSYLGGLRRAGACIHHNMAVPLFPTGMRCAVNVLFADAVARLVKNPSKRYSLPMFAKEIGLSIRQVQFLFKSQTGMTFVAFTRALRIQLVCTLLIETSKSIKEIGALAGYRSTETLCHDFKKVKGCRPSEFRKQNSPRNPTVNRTIHQLNLLDTKKPTR